VLSSSPSVAESELLVQVVRMGMLRRMFWDLLLFVELLVSTVVHATFALNIFLSAVWLDYMSNFTSSPQESARISPVIEADESETDNRERSSCVVVRSESDEHNLGYAGSFMEGHEKAPIVLVHGIFGFGAKVSLYISVYDLFLSPCVVYVILYQSLCSAFVVHCNFPTQCRR
jgi:hypothetical protein